MEFSLGMWAASLVASGMPDRSRWPLGLGGFLCIVGGIAVGHKWGIFHPATDTLFGTGFFLLLLQSAREHKSNHGWSVAGLVRRRSLVWVGTISYSIYLIHQPILQLMANASWRYLAKGSAVFAACVLVFLPMTIGLAYLFHQYCEKPFMSSGTGSKTRVEPGTAAAPTLAEAVA
jgi:peptidoglycan/LPS O-acetylase OafA/YrhL